MYSHEIYLRLAEEDTHEDIGAFALMVASLIPVYLIFALVIAGVLIGAYTIGEAIQRNGIAATYDPTSERTVPIGADSSFSGRPSVADKMNFRLQLDEKERKIKKIERELAEFKKTHPSSIDTLTQKIVNKNEQIGFSLIQFTSPNMPRKGMWYDFLFPEEHQNKLQVLSDNKALEMLFDGNRVSVKIPDSGDRISIEFGDQELILPIYDKEAPIVRIAAKQEYDINNTKGKYAVVTFNIFNPNGDVVDVRIGNYNGIVAEHSILEKAGSEWKIYAVKPLAESFFEQYNSRYQMTLQLIISDSQGKETLSSVDFNYRRKITVESGTQFWNAITGKDITTK